MRRKVMKWIPILALISQACGFEVLTRANFRALGRSCLARHPTIAFNVCPVSRSRLSSSVLRNTAIRASAQPLDSIPILDISPFLHDENSPAGREFVRDLLHICHTIGFVYIVGHGVPPELDTNLLETCGKFFELDEQDRMAIVNTKTRFFRGYTRLGMERTKGAQDWREQIDVGPEHAPLQVTPDDPPWKRLRGPNQWPPALPQLQPVVTDWMHRMEVVSRAVLRALALGLGQPATLFDEVVHPDPEFLLKIIRYPPVERAGGQGVGLHQDSGLLTFINQDAVGGLEIVTDGGDVIAAGRVPGAYIMNLGEMLQLATGGYLRATRHRVVSPVRPRPARVSVAYFFNPRMEARLFRIPLPPALAAEAAGGQNDDPNDPIFETYGDNWLKFRVRSHPDVAAIHHPDLVVGPPPAGPGAAAAAAGPPPGEAYPDPARRA